MSFIKEIIKENIPIWDACAETLFVKELQTGALPQEKMEQYMIQDSIYLKHYARVYGKAIYHSEHLKDIQMYYSVLNFVTEEESHIRLSYLKRFGLTDADIEAEKPLPENRRYIDFLMNIAERGNRIEILMSVLPCLLSYSYVFRKIAAVPQAAGSRYFDFIQDYAEAQYFEDCKSWCEFADEKCRDLPAEEKEGLSAVFRKASLHELAFWEMAYRE